MIKQQRISAALPNSYFISVNYFERFKHFKHFTSSYITVFVSHSFIKDCIAIDSSTILTKATVSYTDRQLISFSLNSTKPSKHRNSSPHPLYLLPLISY